MRLVVLLLVLPAMAGCIDVDDLSPQAPERPLVQYATPGDTVRYFADPVPSGITFSTPLTIDRTRAGGEPVIAVAHDGTIIVSAHPGWTHYHPTADDPDHSELVTGANLQSYLWRSEDNGTNWQHINGPLTNTPRSPGVGFSDPDFTVDGTGRIWYTDLIALAHQSVSYSDDAGRTWSAGNLVAGAGPYVDRQWMGSHGDTVYLTANYFVDRSGEGHPDGARPFQTTRDDGMTWETLGYAPCGGDFLTDPQDGAIVMGCGLGVAISTDQGATWNLSESPAGIHRGFFAHEPAIDTAGGIFLAANGQPLTPHDPATVKVSYTPDRGATWKVIDLDPAISDQLGFSGTHVFAWVTAGTQGRAAVSWIGTPDEAERPDAVQGDWYVFTAFIQDMHTDQPIVEIVQVTPDPVHRGPMCTSGTLCQVQSVVLDPVSGTDNGDRRMGDFFETTLDHDGWLLYAFADTASDPDDVISHPAFVRQTGGPRLLAEGDTWPDGWPTQG